MDEGYPPGNGGGYGYGPADGGYPGQGQQAYGPHDGQPGSPYGQQQYGQYDGYGPDAHQGGAAGYGGPAGYGQYDDYGYDRGPAPSSEYGSSSYGQADYDQRPASGYGPGDGYQSPGAGYGQSSAYPALPPGSGDYPAPQGGSGGYPRAGSGSYPALPGGQDSYPAPRDGSGSYPALPGGQGGYPAPRDGSGGYPALPSGGYPADDAGNDWYGGQPAASKGASFADTGSFRLNGRAIDEYGTGPRGALQDPVRGFPPGHGQQGTGALPVPENPAASGRQPFAGTGAPDIADTRQQGRYEGPAGYPEYGQNRSDVQPGRGPSGGFQGPAEGDGFYAQDGYDEDEYDDYEDGYDSGDPYQDRYGDGRGPNPPGDAGRGPNEGSRGRAAAGPLRGKRLLLAALGVVAVGIMGAAAYVFVLKPSSPISNSNSQRALPSTGSQPSQQACVQQLGIYCHIEAATDDPTLLTTAELFPPAFANEKDKTSYSLVSTKVDKNCGNAVIGSALTKAIKAGKCTQVLRGSYVSGNKKIMGTIGVINLSTTNEAHYAGKVVGQNDFIAPLTSKTGVASKLGNGTGVVESEFKGHYLILTWSEFVDGTDPTTKALDNQLEQFSSDLVAGTANVDLSQRMVTGTAPTPAASAPASASASASAAK